MNEVEDLKAQIAGFKVKIERLEKELTDYKNLGVEILEDKKKSKTKLINFIINEL